MEEAGGDKKLKLGLCWKEALKVVMVQLIINLILLGILISLVVKTMDNKIFLFQWAIPVCIYLIIRAIALFYHGFAITRNTTTHLFVDLFVVVPLLCLIEIGLSIHLINYCMTYISQSSLLPFVIFIFSYQIIDSSYVFLLQSSILLRLKKVTRILSKGYKMRLALIVVMDMFMLAYFIHGLATRDFDIVNIIIVVIFVVHGIWVSYYLKQIIKKEFDEENLPEIPKVQQAAMLIEMSAEEGKNNSSAAA